MTRYIAEGLARKGLLDPGLQDSIVGIDSDCRLEPFCERNRVRFVRADLQEATMDLRGAPFEFFTALDVLEHLEFPQHLLARLAPVVAARAVGILTVPAFPAVYSDWDVAAGHHRRYDLRGLREMMEGC